MWKRSGVGEPTLGNVRGIVTGVMLALSIGATAGCGGDTFDGADAGSASSTNSGNGSSGTNTATATSSTSEQAIPVCTDLCRAQVEAECHSILSNPDSCGLVCGFLDELSQECQDATRMAFQCQLDNSPCSTTGCNDLLKAAEAVCPPLPEF